MRRLMLLPWVTSLAILFVLPLLSVLAMSFLDWDFLTRPRFVGLSNYRELATDPLFWSSLGVTLKLAAVQVTLDVAGGLALALLMQPRDRWTAPFRALCFVPTVLSGVASTMIGLWIFHPDGLVNHFLGGHGPRWFLDPATAWLALGLLNVWGIGRSALIYLAALQELPQGLVQAASLEGATPWQIFRFLTLPQLAPVLVFNALVSLTDAFQAFTGSYVATAGGPLHSTTTLVLYLYACGFESLRAGYAATLAVVTFLLTFGLGAATLRMGEDE